MKVTQETTTATSDVQSCNVHSSDMTESDQTCQKTEEKSKGDGTKEDSNTKEETPQSVSYYKLFRFARALDYLFMFVSLVSAITCALILPVELEFFGRLVKVMVNYEVHKYNEVLNNSTNVTTTNVSGIPFVSDEEFFDECKRYAVWTMVTGSLRWILSYVYVVCINVTAERQVFVIRSVFMKSVLRQDVSWYDTHPTGEFATRVVQDLNKLQDGIGEKLGMFVFFLATFILCSINAFIRGWKLTLVLLSLTPITIISTAIVGKVQTSLAENEMTTYGKAGTIVEECLTAIRTVVAFGGESTDVQRYDNELKGATIAGIKRGLITAVGAGMMWFITFTTNGLAYWYGVKLVIDDRGKSDPEYDVHSMVSIFFCVMMGSMYMGQGAPHLDSFSQAKAAACSIFEVIDRVPVINSTSECGFKPSSLQGNIELDSVAFAYTNRAQTWILNNFNFQVNKGETVALVGESGCGKSTVIQLVQRFYDPDKGMVKIDGCDVKLLNVGWLRDHIGIVGQEPVLFDTTIADNIRYGLEGASQLDVENAAKKANAHSFIMKLPQRYETKVGGRGSQLSGGQKQRLAIARALIKNPPILLLDEATSALDTESESIVQAALDKARLGRTTIIIAHRLTTIRNADRIAVISHGEVAEMGTHKQLMDLDGIYCRLVTNQMEGDVLHGDNEKPKLPVEDIQLISSSGFHRKSTNKQRLSVISNVSLTDIDSHLSVSHHHSYRHKKYEQEEDEDEDDKARPALIEVLKHNKPEWIYILLGCLGAIGMGFCIPVYCLLFGDIMRALAKKTPDEARILATHISIIFVVIGIIAGVACFMQNFMFSVAGEYLTKRLRKDTFAAMLKQEMSWFDSPKNRVSNLCSCLSSDAASVQGATGLRVGTILQSIFCFSISAILAIILHWKMALVSMAPLPLVLASTFLQSKIIMGHTVNEKAKLDQANKIAIDVISNIKTVASMHKEAFFHQLYVGHLSDRHKFILKQVHVRGLIYGFATCVPYACYGMCLFYGGYLILYEKVDVTIPFKISELLIYSTLTIGQALSFAPDYNRGSMAAAGIFKLLRRKPLIDSSDNGLQMAAESNYDIHFKDVHFTYPTRKEMPILRGLDLVIPHGKVVALVGSSGCGKSTCMQLLERFYNPTTGSIMFDDKDITCLNVQWLRSQIGIVSQEPILFDRTIAENIAYGDNTRSPSSHEIVQAAINANAHKFISDFPLGYDTRVGDKGTQLSGGQKQKLAIARAILRSPKILLLDEATSALDTESERIVQETLEQAQKGRTCIVVAHRLSTIKDADFIAVIYRGKVVEIGTHEQLLALGRHYHKFYQIQTKGKTH